MISRMVRRETRAPEGRRMSITVVSPSGSERCSPCCRYRKVCMREEAGQLMGEWQRSGALTVELTIWLCDLTNVRTKLGWSEAFRDSTLVSQSSFGSTNIVRSVGFKMQRFFVNLFSVCSKCSLLCDPYFQYPFTVARISNVYFGTTVTNENVFHQEMKRRSNHGLFITVQFKILSCLPVSCIVTQILEYTEISFYLLSYGKTIASRLM